MAANQSLTLDQRIALRLSAQQIRFVKLLEMNAPELDDAIEKELDVNPALEVAEEAPAPARDSDIPRYRTRAVNSSPDDSGYEFSPPDDSESLYDHLLRQLAERDLPENVRLAAEYIIGNLDPNGYLRRPILSIVDDMAFGPGIIVEPDDARAALVAVQGLEPFGVGAADLRESLIIQLRHLPESTARDNALRIVTEQFEPFSMRHSHKLISNLKLTHAEVKEATDLIATLNPKPGAALDSNSDAANVIVPDVIVGVEDDELTVATNNRIPELVIGRTFSEAMRELENKKRNEKKGSEFIISSFNDARDFIRILRQRQETLVNVMTAIIKIQKEYFMTQDVYRLKPMMIKDVSALTGYDLSVISRATNNKYVSTPWGVFPMRFFFSDSIGEESEEASDAVTNRKIEAEIRELVEKEDKRHPLSDEKLRLEMEGRGFDVSRRTVAKYRDRLGIPVARLRKEL